jgi:hypothetical protein
VSRWQPPWPGFGAPGSLVLPLPATSFASLPDELRLDDGLLLARKREFHVTLFDSKVGARLHEPAAGGAPAQALAGLFAGFDWQWRSRGERWLLLDAAHEPARHSVIELIEMPALAEFRAAVGVLLGEPLPATPAHVTLYVAPGQRGIGIRDFDAFERLRLRRL